MKLYRYHLTHPDNTRHVYWHHDKNQARYWGDTSAELRYGIQKGAAQGVVMEVEVPTADAEALAKWLNDQFRD